MFKSLDEYKFFQSFRIPVEEQDGIRYSFDFMNDRGQYVFIEDTKLVDLSASGIGMRTQMELEVGASVRVSLEYKRVRIDVETSVVRGISSIDSDKVVEYGLEVDLEDSDKMHRFVRQYAMGFPPERARQCLANMALSTRNQKQEDGVEMFSLMLSLFMDITSYGHQEDHLKTLLDEVVNVMNAQRASVFLINPETNELEAKCALGIDKDILKFDYRKGIAGTVFTTGIPLNIDARSDTVRFSHEIDSKTGFETRSIICAPFSNFEDKVIGVVEVLNKRNGERFSVGDELTMKVVSVIFSSLYHKYNPMSDKSLIRRFSAPKDRKFAFIGKSNYANEIRRGIVKLKDIDSPLLIEGEFGVGKKLLAQIIHNEGKRGLNDYQVIQCKGRTDEELIKDFISEGDHMSVFQKCQGGSVLIDEIGHLSLDVQNRLLEELKKLGKGPGELNVRVMASTTLDLTKLAQKEGEFNLELLGLLSTTRLEIAALRKKPEDLEELAYYFLKKECANQGLLLKELDDEVIGTMKEYEWPGNVYELQQVISKLVLYHPKAHKITKISHGATPIIDLKQSHMHGLDEIEHARDFELPLKDRVVLVEREMILAEVKRHRGNKSQAAKSMGISREALRKKLLQSEEIITKIEGDNAPRKLAA